MADPDADGLGEDTASAIDVEQRPFRRRVLINTAAVGVANGWAMLSTLLSLPFVLHGLGATRFGVWALLQTFSAVGGWFSLLDLGLSTATTRQVAAHHAIDERRGVSATLGSSLAMFCGLGLVSGVAFGVLGSPLFSVLIDVPSTLVDEVRLAVLAFSVQVALDLVCGGFQAALDGFQRVDLSRAVDIVRRTLVAVATAVAATASGDLGQVAVASAAGVAIAAVFGLGLLIRTARSFRPSLDKGEARALLAYGKTVAVLRPLGVLHRSIDRLIVGAILGPAAVSLVEVATQLQNGADAVLSATSYAVVPSAARLEAHGETSKLRELTATGTRYVLLATWPVAALTAVLSAPAIAVWVGKSYSAAAGLVVLAVVSVALAAPAQVGSNMLLGTGRAGTILKVALIGIAINAGLSVVLVNLVGTAGTFQATVVSALVSSPLLVNAAIDDIDLRARTFWSEAVLPAVPAALAAGALAGLVVLAPLAPWPTLLAGGFAGSIGWLAGAIRFGLKPSEVFAVSRRLHPIRRPTRSEVRNDRRPPGAASRG
ncbi:MAG: polysaccharide biosynthesis protein [Acidimicrobiales bacterium]|nr:polysaccharide biosynthesis protein [Acidimicrobiales bacterium]